MRSGVKKKVIEGMMLGQVYTFFQKLFVHITRSITIKHFMSFLLFKRQHVTIYKMSLMFLRKDKCGQDFI